MTLARIAQVVEEPVESELVRTLLLATAMLGKPSEREAQDRFFAREQLAREYDVGRITRRKIENAQEALLLHDPIPGEDPVLDSVTERVLAYAKMITDPAAAVVELVGTGGIKAWVPGTRHIFYEDKVPRYCDGERVGWGFVGGEDIDVVPENRFYDRCRKGDTRGRGEKYLGKEPTDRAPVKSEFAHFYADEILKHLKGNARFVEDGVCPWIHRFKHETPPDPETYHSRFDVVDRSRPGETHKGEIYAGNCVVPLCTDLRPQEERMITSVADFLGTTSVKPKFLIAAGAKVGYEASIEPMMHLPAWKHIRVPGANL